MRRKPVPLTAPRTLRRRIGRIALRLLLGIAAALALFAAGAYGWLSYGSPVTAGRMSMPGLQHDVGVYRDADGVPHIFAADDADAYRALGFVHAQDRLFQMEMFRRTGAGRLAEILGQPALPVDRFMRLMGFYRAASASLDHLDPPTRQALIAYAEGVNAYIAQHRGAYAPEFFLLGIRPEPWRPADSLVFGRIMSVLLSGDYRAAATRAELAKRLQPDELKQLFPDDPGAAKRQRCPPRAPARRWRAPSPPCPICCSPGSLPTPGWWTGRIARPAVPLSPTTRISCSARPASGISRASPRPICR